MVSLIKYSIKDRQNIAILAIFLIISFILFGNGIKGDFVYDDLPVIAENPLVTGASIDVIGIFSSSYKPGSPETGTYRPFIILSYALQYELFGSSPVSFHILNIVLHALVTWMIFIITRRYTEILPAFIASAFFMFLPIHVEAVTSIVGRAELLSLLFSLLTVYFFISGKYNASAGFLFIGLLSKETSIAVLPVLALFYFLSERNIRNISWHCLAVLSYFIIRILVLKEYSFGPGDINPIYNPLIDTPVFSSTITALKVFWLYLIKTLVPLNLSPDYSLNQVNISLYTISVVQAVSSFAVLMIILFYTIKSRILIIRLGALYFLSAYFLISNLFLKIGTIMGERLFYAPTAGLAILSAYFFNLMWQSKKYRTAFCFIFTAVIIFYGWTIIDYNHTWLNKETFFEHGFYNSPNSIVMKANYAQNQFIAGNKKEATNIMEEVVDTYPESSLFLTVTGEFHAIQGNMARAEELWLKSIETDPDELRAYFNLGTLYYSQKKYQAAESILSRSVGISPLSWHIVYLGLSKIRLNKPREALEIINKHYGLSPDKQELALVIGLSYLTLGDGLNAEKYLSKVTDTKVQELAK